MKSFSKLKLEFDLRKDNGYCYVDVRNENDLGQCGWMKIGDFITWINTVGLKNQEKIGSVQFSKRLFLQKEDEKYNYFYFYYEQSVRDITAYQRGTYVHKTVFLPQLITEVRVDKLNGNNWNIKIFGFEGKLSANTVFFALKLPHFYNDGGLCIGNLPKFKKIQELNEMDNLLNYIFNTKFIHEWNEIHELFTEPLHYVNGLGGLKNYSQISNELFKK